jgi:hypothetical protein
MSIFQSPLWGTILQILRDPIFSLIFSVILAILAARVVRKVIKVIFYLAALVVLVWLVTHNKSFADICIAIVSTVFNILLVLIVVVAVISVVPIICVLIMFIMSKPSSHRRERSSLWNDSSSLGETIGAPLPTGEEAEIRATLAAGQHVSAEHAKMLLCEKYRRIVLLMQDLTSVFESLGNEIDEERPLKMLVSMAHIYFSGLSRYMTQIRKIHWAFNSEITDLASILPAIFADVDVQRLRDMARAKTFLPDRDEWQDVKDDVGISIPYVLLILFCLHPDWKEVGTVLYKGYYSATMLNEYIEAL